MTFVGSYFGMGLGNTLFIIIFFISGLVIGLNTKIISSLSIFLFIYLGSLFGNGQGKVLSVLIFFILSLFFVKKLKNVFKENKNYINHLI